MKTANTVSLDGPWLLRYAPHKSRGTPIVPETPRAFKDWVAAQVPGDVHMDLMNAGIIPDYNVGNNSEKCLWLEGKDWWYLKEFTVSPSFRGDRLELVFHGLDLDCDVWLNGEKTGSHSNAFRPLTVDVTHSLKRSRTDKNLLIVRIDDGSRRMNSSPSEKYRAWVRDGRVWLRKPQYVFGWDWAPRLATCGIWRSVELRALKGAAIRSLRFRPGLRGDKGIVLAEAEVENVTGREINAGVTFGLSGKGGDKREFHRRLRPGTNTIRTKLAIDKPRLWWPVGYGEPTLYKGICRVSIDGSMVDEKSEPVGFRSVKWEQKSLGRGEKTFTLVVNGRRIFAKGANWIPAEALPGCVTKERYSELLDRARDCNFNMLRVWGGGIYEDDGFYRGCDERGIMIFHDFMYACALYPGDDPAFRKEAALEAEYQIKRLRNHPSIVLWCGNNEIEEMAEQFSSRAGKTGKFTFYGKNIWHGILPRLVEKLDPDRFYLPSSPYLGSQAASRKEGDVHSWLVSIHGKGEEAYDYRTYAEENGKFISEYGCMGVPSRETLKTFLPSRERYFHSHDWDFHGNMYEEGSLGNHITWRVKQYVGDPDKMSFDELLFAKQFLQAEALKFAIEHFRRRKWHCSGSLYWMYNDVWPVTSGWCTFDYDGTLRPSYFAVKRAYAPVLLSLKDEAFDGGDKGGFSCWLINEKSSEVGGTLVWKYQDFCGNTLCAGEKAVRVGPDRSRRVLKMKTPKEFDAKRMFVWASLLGGKGEVIASNTLFFNMPGELTLPKTKLETELKKVSSKKFAVTFLSRELALMVFIDSPPSVKCGDNAFNLLPGIRRTVVLESDEKQIRKLRLRALNVRSRRL